MAVTSTHRGTDAGGRAVDWSSPEMHATQAARPLEKANGLTRLGCTLCEESFIIDMEEHWGTRPEEMEILGREFLGVRNDDVLCAHCLHLVELTGAQRIYWRLAHR